MYAVSVSMQKRYETHLTQAAKTTRDALGATHEKGTTRKTPLHGNATAGATLERVRVLQVRTC